MNTHREEDKGKMKEEQNFAIRTDLAIEAREMIEEQNGDVDDGIVVKNEETDTMNITYVEILNENGSKAMGKPQGNYITIESDKLKINDVSAHQEISHKLLECITELSKAKEDTVFLVVGLGNWNITPDALGPKVVSKIFVTRHMFDTLPKELDGAVRPVAAVSPGVMGITGIETGEIIKGIVEKMKPNVIIAIDALAARRFNRINATIQLSDTGISPGAGVGNRRMALNEETLGVPVIAIGVPTVVDAATLVNDTMDTMLTQMKQATDKGTQFYDMLENMEGEERYQLIYDLLDPYAGNMFVTPKEVDAVIDRLSGIIASAINSALHPGIEIEDMGIYNC
ncbi:MAG: GPR endopeptidase [Anaerotignaceae bacterium]